MHECFSIVCSFKIGSFAQFGHHIGTHCLSLAPWRVLTQKNSRTFMSSAIAKFISISLLHNWWEEESASYAFELSN